MWKPGRATFCFNIATFDSLPDILHQDNETTVLFTKFITIPNARYATNEANSANQRQKAPTSAIRVKAAAGQILFTRKHR